MKSMSQCAACNGLGLLLARVPLGVVLALAGYEKIARQGVESFVSERRGLAEHFMSPALANLYLHAVPYAELALGGLLVLGLATRLSGFLAALMLLSFGLATGGVDGFFDPHPALAPELFKAPFTYGVLALVAFLAGPGKISLDGLFFGRRVSAKVWN